jgi:hypothetical protein
MMPNGKVLFAVGTIDAVNFPAPTTLFEFDLATDALTQVTAPGPNLNVQPFECRMLVLPSGQVLFGNATDNLFVYNPDGSPVAAGKPTISAIAGSSNSFTLTGTQLNGISEGAGYGDDAQMASNYPIIRLADPFGDVFYARTSNWSSTGVATGTTPVSTSFALAPGVDSTVPAVVTAVAPVGVTEGAPLDDVTVATFTDPSGNGPLTKYSATVDWGDGTSSPGTISGPDANGVYTVKGSHVYAEESSPEHPGSNPYTLTVSVQETSYQLSVVGNGIASDPATFGGSTGQGSASVTVADPAVVAKGGLTLIFLECQALPGVPVATFTDPGGPEAAGDYSATIQWGDGSTSTGTITGPDAGGVFTVLGSNAFAEEGTFQATVTIGHEGAPPAQVSNTVIVKDNAGIILLDPTGQGALRATGNGTVTVADVNHCGAIVIDSSSPGAAEADGQAVVSAGEYDITGVPGTRTSGQAAFLGEIDDGEPPTADPLAALAVPAAPSPTFGAVDVSGGAPRILQPGTYDGGIHVTGQGSVILQPGVYFLRGGGLSVSGQGRVTGDGVLLVNGPQGPNDGISITGQGAVHLSAPTIGTYQGIAIFQDRGSSAQVTITGNGSLDLSGILYAASATIRVDGGGLGVLAGNSEHTVGAQIIVADLEVTGHGRLTVDVSANTPDNLHIGLADLTAAGHSSSVPGSPGDVHSAALSALMKDGGLKGQSPVTEQGALDILAAGLAAISGSSDWPLSPKKGKK